MSALDDIIARDSAPQQASALDAIIARDGGNAPTQTPPGQVIESRSPDGALRLEMGGSAPPPQSSPSVMRNLATGALQGAGDMPAGFAQSQMHQGMQILQQLDNALGTHLSQAGQQNLMARDAEVAKREADYQAATPDSPAAGAGRVLGNLAFAAATTPTAAFTAPIAAGARAGERLLPMAPNLGKYIGAMLGSGAQSGTYGAVSPVIAHSKPGGLADLVTGLNSSDDYRDQVKNNVLTSAALGFVAPPVADLIGGALKYAGGVARSLIDPFTAGGRDRIASGVLASAGRGGSLSQSAAQIVPGSAPTLAEATANPGIATLQRTVRDLNPTPFIEREQANASARLRAFEDAAGTPDKLDFFKADRASTAQDLYGKAIANYTGDLTPYLKGQITQLLKRPSIDKASRMAQTWAIERGEKPAPEGSLLALHDVKTAIDDMIGRAVRDGAGGEAQALQGTKDKLLNVMERMSPDYAQARVTYGQMSQPINAMETLQGLKLTDQMGNITLQKIQTAIRSIQDRMAAPGISAAKSVDANQLGVLTSIRDDLLRSKNTELGKSVGSATAQNLATQSMMANLLPGRIGAFAGKLPAGSIGSALGGGLGLVAGGPIGAGVGAGIGGSVGRTFSNLMNMQNDVIQSRLASMLLDPGLGGAALQSAARRAAPSPQAEIIKRLLLPPVNAGLGLGSARIEH